MAVNMEMNVLIVDDYATMLRIIGNLLKQLVSRILMRLLMVLWHLKK